MTKEEHIYIASLAIEKRMDYSDLYYSDPMHGHKDETDEVWDYISECEDIGKASFKEKYKEYCFYPGF